MPGYSIGGSAREMTEVSLQIKGHDVAAPLVPPPKKVRVDTSALNGFRGFAAFYIMIFHYILHQGFNILGTTLMPLFFLISGFVFGLCEGNKKYELTKCCTELRSFSDGKVHFDGRKFYARRAARTLPLYYLSNLMMLPIIYLYGNWNTAC